MTKSWKSGSRGRPVSSTVSQLRVESMKSIECLHMDHCLQLAKPPTTLHDVDNSRTNDACHRQVQWSSEDKAAILKKTQIFCGTTPRRLSNSYRNLRADFWHQFQEQQRRVHVIMYQNNWIFKHNREILGHSPSSCQTRTFMDLPFRSHQIIPDLSVHWTFHDVCFFASHWRPFLAPAGLTAFTTARPALKPAPIKRYNYSLSQQSILKLRSSRM